MTTRSIWRPDKDEVVAEHGAVATAHPLAAQVGVEVLRQGGNAVDAAIATGFCLNVVEPWNSSIAGHGQMIVHMTSTGKTVALDYGHRAPGAATAGMFTVAGQLETGNGIYEVEGRANSVGHLAVGVPGVTAGMCRAHELFGSLPLEQLVEPAVHYAREGFEADSTTCLMIAQTMADLIEYGEAGRVFMPDGYPPAPGERVVQRDLADTLERIGRQGRDALYAGDVAHAIDEEMTRHGGVLRADDLAAYEAQVLDPAQTGYRGYRLLGSPVPAGTITQLQTLNILESFDLSAMAHNSPEYLHLFIEAARHAFADRYRFLGDPDFGPVPLDGMLSEAYAREIASSIDHDRAALEDERKLQPWAALYEKSERVPHDPWRYDPQPRPQRSSAASPPSFGDCTTHLSVIDKDRNMVSCTQTAVAGFGSRVMVPGTGILLTNGMVVFNPMPGTPNSIAGHKRGLNNMGPMLVLRDGRPFMSLGAPGGRRIMDRLAQVLLNIIDHGMGVQEAITAPTVDAAERETFIDHRIEEATVEALGRMGHNVEIVPDPATGSGFARPRGVLVDPHTGRLHAGVHPMGTDEARGY
jgi:gamma-glutamyltranspeptidase/glutathione hydrolase